MSSDRDQKLSDILIAWGDDELILGHRDSEWCGHAPIIEEDIAFANLALDEIGHAVQWYGLAAELSGEAVETYPDQLAYRRSPSAYRCCQMVELPRGDWAFTMLRQYLLDAAEIARLEGLSASSYEPLSAAAIKVRKEEVYHLRHTTAWMKRLAGGTEESHRRMQIALDGLWKMTGQLFRPQDGETELAKEGILPAPEETRKLWSARVLPLLDSSGLVIPQVDASLQPPSRMEHTQHLEILLAEMQSLPSLYPDAEW